MMDFRRPAVLLLGVALASAGACGGDSSLRTQAAPPPAQPQTLVRVRVDYSDAGPVYGFAQDRNMLVWAAEEAQQKNCPLVRSRDLSSRSQTVIGEAGDYMCDEYGFWIAAAGTRALWAGFEPANHPIGSIVVGGRGQTPRRVGGLASDYSESGDVVVDVVGDGTTLAYATVFVVPNDWDACYPEDSPRAKTCRFRVRGGVVKRIEGTKAISIPRVAASAAIAVSAGKLAIVPADLRWGHVLHARENGPLEIRDVRTGRLALDLRPRGEVVAVALSKTVVAALVREGGVQRLEVYDLQTGARRSSVPVGAKAAPELSAAGTAVVYHDRKVIRILRAGEQTTWLVAIAAGEPFDLSIEGGRVVWAENKHGEGRIQAMHLR